MTISFVAGNPVAVMTDEVPLVTTPPVRFKRILFIVPAAPTVIIVSPVMKSPPEVLVSAGEITPADDISPLPSITSSALAPAFPYAKLSVEFQPKPLIPVTFEVPTWL